MFTRQIAKILLLTSVSMNLLNLETFAAETSKPQKPVESSNLDIILKGYFEFESGFRNQGKIKSADKKVSHNRDTFAFHSRGAFYAKGQNEFNDAIYGAKIVLVPTALRKSGGDFNGSHLFVVTDYGKFEAGSPIDSSSQMSVGAGDIVASGGTWYRYAKKSPRSFQFNGASSTIATSSDFWLDGSLSSSVPNRVYSDEPSRSISYYTPKFELTPSTKFQAGITFTPDTSNTGADSLTKQSSGVDKRVISVINENEKEVFEIDRTSKDVISGGFTVEQTITDGVDVKIGATGETGKSAGKAVRKFGNTKIAEYSLTDLKSYNVGAVVTLGNFAVAGNYGSLGKSLTTKEYYRTGRNTNYYEGAVAYNQGGFKTSVKYFGSEQYKNKAQAIVLGTDFNLAPGLKPYASISTFNIKARPEFYPEAEKKKTRGTVGILGAKLSL